MLNDGQYIVSQHSIMKSESVVVDIFCKISCVISSKII